MAFALMSKAAARPQRAAMRGRAVAAPIRRTPARVQPVGAMAFFNFMKPKTVDANGAPIPFICIDCGYVYQGGDFGELPNNYKCPACNVGKNRFKPYKVGNQGTRAAKRANQEAFRAKRAAARKAAEMDANKKKGRR
eukprot:CAMPEP_0183789420 /NCGR_PEP_ID=MMETSP0803_2-20130417/413_1 /TAXON_ID=195967 /ORGANISM="Crustomastix stigmata, Strain CCMP3273" /LENGTH=136 /DNA_ID=CAMNT_0026033589 /DNA_START=41 /DNA_END=451 /DNA_ORIENTATION=+